MSENVFVGADSFRRLLLGAAGGYELQGRHEAAETVLRVIDALDELTTGGKGGDRADEDQEAMAAASKLRRKIDGKNPTPKTLEECWEDLKKEIGDVMNSIDALTEQDPQNYHEFMSECGEYAEPKMERWLYRLTEQEGKP